jgi:type VI secretion system protein ImpC
MAKAQTEAAPAAATATAEFDAASWMDAATNGQAFREAEDEAEKKRNQSYLGEFIKSVLKPGQVLSKDVESFVKAQIAAIDQKLSSQLNEVLHAPEFQRLEGTWRGLSYLVQNTETGTDLKIRVLNARKRDILSDIEKAVEFDQSSLFKSIYEAEYGVLGGTPYGLLVADYEFDRMADDITMLRGLSNIAAASHAPLVSNASAKLFAMNRFDELANPRDLSKIFETPEYAGWQSFRDSEDSRYVALCMPRVLGRMPYGADSKPITEFNYEEGVDGRDHDKYLWMGAAWAYAQRVGGAFKKDGWFSRTRGVEGGGKVEGLPVSTFKTDTGDVAMKCPTEVAITDRREFELSNLGFLPLIHAKGKDFAAFIGTQSCQKPKKYFDPEANSNAELSAKLNLILNTSRFAHYLKVMARNWLGLQMEPSECEVRLNNWIQNYVLPDPSMVGEKQKAEKPLKDARIEVKGDPKRPGYYNAVAYLRPHYQLEGLSASMRLVASVPKKTG